MQIKTLEPYASPKHKMGFLCDWRVTMKCNYDCTYCGGHDNRQAHPDKELCLTMLGQAMSYIDTVMDVKKPRLRSATLNIYGGEALYHPDIVYLLKESSELYKKYSHKWSLTRLLTTNASCKEDKWKEVVKHLEYVQFSYHTEGPGKLKENFLRNLEVTHKSGKRYGGIVVMYPKNWQECVYMLKFMQKKGYNIQPKLVDGPTGNYTEEHFDDLRKFWPRLSKELTDKMQNVEIIRKGRACCGERLMCINRDFKHPAKFVPQPNNSYVGFNCSANQFFLMADSHTKSFYTNKDCRVTLDGKLGALATSDTMDDYISSLKSKLENDSNTYLTCVQKTCICGICAPKSTSIDELKKVMKVYNL